MGLRSRFETNQFISWLLGRSLSGGGLQAFGCHEGRTCVIRSMAPTFWLWAWARAGRGLLLELDHTGLLHASYCRSLL